MGFGNAGFASGFASGANAMNGIIETYMRARSMGAAQDRQAQQDEFEKQKWADQKAMQERGLTLREQEAGMEREYRQGALDIQRQQQARLGEQAGREAEAWDYKKHSLAMEEANQKIKDYMSAANAATATGNPLPAASPDVMQALQKRFSPNFIADPKGTADQLQSTMSGVHDGSIPLTDPRVGSAINTLIPWAATRGIGEQIKAPVNDGVNPEVPAGAKIVSKQPLGFMHLDDGGLVPVLDITAEKDGQQFKYHAPLTERGTSDGADNMVRVTPEMVQGAVNTHVAAGNDPHMQELIKMYNTQQQMTPEGQKAARDAALGAVKVEESKAKTLKYTAQAAKAAGLTGEGGAVKGAKEGGKKATFNFKPTIDYLASNIGSDDDMAAEWLNRRTGGKSANMEEGVDIKSKAMAQASKDVGYMHTLNSDLTHDEIASIVATGEFTAGVVNVNGQRRIAEGYKLPDGGFVPIKLGAKMEEVQAEQQKQSTPPRPIPQNVRRGAVPDVSMPSSPGVLTYGPGSPK